MHKGMQVHGALNPKGNNKCRWTLPLRSVSDQRQGGTWNGPKIRVGSGIDYSFHLLKGARSIFPYLNNNDRE